MALTESQIQEVYVAYFGRPADVEGKSYWSSSSAGVSSTAEFAGIIHAQSEFQDAYGSKKTATQINQIYQNLFSRDADAEGLEYWTGQIGNGTLKLAEIAVHLIYAAKNNAGGDADKAALENKVAAATAFTTDVAADATAQLAYTADDATAFTTAKTFITGITATAATAAEVDAQVATIKTDYTAAQLVGTTYDLTTGVDAIVGTAKNDTINGVIDADAANTVVTQTFSSSDSIDGGDGTDTLSVVFKRETGNTALIWPSASISNVETFEIQNIDDQNVATIDFASIAGESLVINNLSTVAIDFDNLASGTAVDIVGNGGATGVNATTAVDYVAAATSSNIEYKGGVDNGALTVTGTGITSQTIESTGARNDADLITLAATTTSLTIHATSEFRSGIVAGAAAGNHVFGLAETLTITGSAAVNLLGANLLTSLDADTDTVDGSASTGDIDILTGAVAVNEAAGDTANTVFDLTVTTGSGNDDVQFANTADRQVNISTGAGDDVVTTTRALVATNAAGTTAADTINGGDGTDTLEFTTGTINGHATLTAVTNFEEIGITDRLVNAFDIDDIQATGINTVDAQAGVGAGSDIQFNEGTLGTLNLQGAASNGQLDVRAGGATSTTTSDQVTINNGMEATNVFASQDITAHGIETLVIDTTGVEDADTAALNVATNQQVGAVDVTTNITDDGVATLKITGSNQLTTAAITAQHIDASASTGALIQNNAMVGFDPAAGVTNNNTLKGGSGADTLRGDADDVTVIDGNAGNDTIFGGAAADTINGGAGNDTITSNNGADTINGDAGDDLITLSNADLATVDGGAGDDTVVVNALLTFGQDIKGGAGTDTLRVTADRTAPQSSVVSGFETLDLNGAAAYDLDDFTNNTFNTVVTGGFGAMSVTGVGSELFHIDNDLTGDFTITMDDLTGTSDVVNLKISTDADGNLTNTTEDLIVDGFETINLESDDALAVNGNLTNVAHLNASDATTLTITGDSGLQIAGAGTTDVDQLTTVNASGLVLDDITDAGLNYASTNNTNDASVTITGTNGVDNLTGAALANDTISGGDGVDTIVYTGGRDTLTGGAGNDIFDINARQDSVTDGQSNWATITDFTAGDVLDFQLATYGLDIADSPLGAAISLDAGATFANYLDNAASSNAGGTGADATLVNWFQHDSNTFLVLDAHADTTFNNGVDMVVSFTGLVDLSAATITDVDQITMA